MKKLMIAAIVAAMLISNASVYADDAAEVKPANDSQMAEQNEVKEKIPYYVYDKATVKSVENGSINCTTNDDEEISLILNVSEDTLILDNNGNKISLSDLKEGTVIYAYDSPYNARILIYPATFKPYVIVAATDENVNFCLDAFSKDPDSKETRYVSDGGKLAVNISDETEFKGYDGSEITDKDLESRIALITYTDSTRSIPAITTAKKVTILGAVPVVLPDLTEERPVVSEDTPTVLPDLSEERPVVTESETDKTIKVAFDGEKMNFDVDPIIENGRTLVPFRAIFEKLDCAVSYSETDGGKFVEAQRGDDVVLLEIGKDTMLVNGKEVKLDAPAKIVDGRTLVPLRAVSESMDCTVDWLDDVKTASIHKKHGQHIIDSGRIEKSITDSDGTVLMNISAVYPIIADETGSDAFIADINKSYKENAEKYVSDIEKTFTKDDAAEMRKAMGENFRPMQFTLTFKVNTDRKNLLSITNTDYQNANGAHPNTQRTSRTFQTLMNKELALTDVFDAEQDAVNKTVYDTFKAKLEKEVEEYSEENAKELEKELANVNFYLTDNSVVMYFNPYQILPYAFGAPSVELKYGEKDSPVKLDLSEAKLDALEIVLDGNPTTGFTWEAVEADSEIVDIKSEYKQDEAAEDMAGVGGKYTFTVTGKSNGNAQIKLCYMRSFEGEGSIQKTVIVKVYVDENGKVTVLDRTEK